jgi:hypothetical protein
MLDRQTRELLASGSDPLFEAERRKMPWIKDASSLTMYRKMVWIGVAVVSLVVWIALTISKYKESDFQDNLLLFAICLSAIVMVVIDVHSTLIVANYLHHQLRSKAWELVRLTPQNHESILQALFNLAQIRAWRPMVFEVAVRIAAAELILWGIVRLLISRHVAISELFNPFAWIFLTPIGISITIYVLEPMWRMKAFAALSLAVVSTIENMRSGELILCGATALVHVFQIAIPAAVFIYFRDRPNDYFGLEALLCGLPLNAMVQIGLTYAFYGYLKRRALNAALKSMFRPAD